MRGCLVRYRKELFPTYGSEEQKHLAVLPLSSAPYSRSPQDADIQINGTSIVYKVIGNDSGIMSTQDAGSRVYGGSATKIRSRGVYQLHRLDPLGLDGDKLQLKPRLQLGELRYIGRRCRLHQLDVRTPDGSSRRLEIGVNKYARLIRLVDNLYSFLGKYACKPDAYTLTADMQEKLGAVLGAHAVYRSIVTSVLDGYTVNVDTSTVMIDDLIATGALGDDAAAVNSALTAETSDYKGLSSLYSHVIQYIPHEIVTLQDLGCDRIDLSKYGYTCTAKEVYDKIPQSVRDDINWAFPSCDKKYCMLVTATLKPRSMKQYNAAFDKLQAIFKE